MLVRTWTPTGTETRRLVFCRGFLLRPDGYDEMLTLVASHGVAVFAPVSHRRDPAALVGMRSPPAEAHDVGRLVSELGHPAIAGHSRGGQVAWLVARDHPVAGLVAIDPVARTSPRGPSSNHGGKVQVAAWDAPTMIIGASHGGRCAPKGRNHEVFVAAAPDRARHIVAAMGHGDMLSGGARRLVRAICSGVEDPSGVPRAVGGLVVCHLLGVPTDGCPVSLAE